jgi:glycosyltransferase involved in cell wall biosynthesis
MCHSCVYHLAVPTVDSPLGNPAVCLVSGEFPPDAGGVGDYTARLAQALAARAVPVGILTSHRPGRPSRRLLAPTGGTVAIPVWAGVRGWGPDAWPTVVGALRRLGPQPILHIQYQAGAFGLGGGIHLLPVWVRARLPRARVITTFHDVLVPYLFPKAGPLRTGANRLLARASHAAIFTDPADRATMGVAGQVIPIGSNVDCAPPPDFDRARARRWLGADEETLLIGYFGFLNASKGVPTLVRAVASLAAAGRSVRLALIGAAVGTSDPTDLAECRVVHALRVGAW